LAKTHLVIPDTHATPGVSNRRAEWIGRFINDVKPDRVIHLGDSADLSSLASYDKGKKSFQGRTYRADIDSHLDFNVRLWDTVKKAKKKLPHRIFLEGNHEERIRRAIELQSELEGTISSDDLRILDFYDEFIEYEGSTPGIRCIDGVYYSHYAVSGVMGRPVSGEHPAYSLVSKQHVSYTVGHTHVLDYCIRTVPDGKKVQALVAGCCFEHNPPWAGNVSRLYWRGIVLKRNVDQGSYDPQFISLDWLRKNYG
jgi:hypothetical protein